jgi:hypothetical protein
VADIRNKAVAMQVYAQGRELIDRAIRMRAGELLHTETLRRGTAIY